MLCGFCGGCQNARKSTNGYLLKIGDNTIAWGSQKQRVVTLSTAEAEYDAAAQGLKKLIWIQKLFVETVTEVLKTKDVN